ncbi:MAG: S8 family peptidase [Bdellovibrionota bacterium]
MKNMIMAALVGLSLSGGALASEGDYLVKLKGNANGYSGLIKLAAQLPAHAELEDLGGLGWYRVKVPTQNMKMLSLRFLKSMPGVAYAQPNFKIKLLENPSLTAARAAAVQALQEAPVQDCPIPGACSAAKIVDNPEIPAVKAPGTGADPLFGSQWGMGDIGVTQGWGKSKGDGKVVVAVIDTGVDYTHEDLVENLWRNPGEMGTDANGKDKATNGVDDDNNGYIDDLVGWDVVMNDNKPFDMAKTGIDLLFGGNPGHGTHCAGNVAARGFNGKGISGVAPNVSVMILRFLGEDGSGTSGGAVKSILYAINNGAKVLSNSWGSEGEDPNDPDNQALKDAIKYAQEKGVIFIAAAGNGHNGVGYDNDTDAKPGVPASYADDIIVSVAAIDSANELGAFSNWGKTSVDIAAPGVKVFSTMVTGTYNDTVLDLPQLGIKATWDGTSMATPHVAGAAALYLSYKPTATWREIKDALLKTAKPITSVSGKVVSNGKLSVDGLMAY